jgi:RND family efflux transporter MFP subunit
MIVSAPFRRALELSVGSAIGFALLAGCRRPAPPAAPPPVGVEYVTLAAKPIERTTEHIATVKSRRSSSVKPMVEGLVTRIAVKSGDQVRAGQTILEIDASRQRATVAGVESLRAAREADLTLAQREAERQKQLFQAGAASAKDAEQAATDLQNAEAQLHALDEQLKEQRVALAYYRVTAPTGGTVGDVPVRVGDRVTSATELTTLDTGGGLELYVHVPVRYADELRPGMAVRVVSDEGERLVETTIDFVSPQVDEATQTVLAKAWLAGLGSFRTEQQVRARIVWSEKATLAVPVVAVSRVSGRTFAFVVENGEKGAVARQRTIELGPIVGNDYVVLNGLAAGDQLIVTGIQKVRDGVPVDAKPQAAVAQG